MTWTYGCDPENDNGDAVRLLIGDTDTTDQQLKDEEIDFFLAQEANIYSAACGASMALSGKYSRLADKEVGDLKLRLSQRSEHYQALCDVLSARASFALGDVFTGGVSVSGKETLHTDTNRVPPYFIRDQFDNQGVISNEDDAGNLTSGS